MKYLLYGHGWPIGSALIPLGTIISMPPNDDWSRLAAGRTPPINAQALDQEAWDALVAAYDAGKLVRKGF